MKKAFTMIELIFVITIIGVLVAIAMPKLNATKDDSKISEISANAKSLFTDFQSFYISRGNKSWNDQTIHTVTDVFLRTDCSTPTTSSTRITPKTFVLCNNNIVCLSFTTINEGNLTIRDGTNISDSICEGVKDVISFSNRSYRLGGNTIKNN